MAAGSMNLGHMDDQDPDSADHFVSTSVGTLNSRRKAQDRRTAHQSNNPSFASNVDNMVMKANAQSLLGE